jgi:two-component system sensor histidine kinase SenX3
VALWRKKPVETLKSSAAEDNLHLSLAQMRTALNALPMGVIVFDKAGEEWWRNRAAHDQLDRVADTDAISTTIDTMSRAALRGRSDRAEILVDGPPQKMIESRAVPLVNGGALVVLEDITERYLTDRVRTDFVANISHELKTPVGALSVLAETIVGEAEFENPEGAEESDLVALARRMVGESNRVARIIDDLLELARIEFGGAASKDEVFVRNVVSEAVARQQPLADSQGIKVVKNITDEDMSMAGDARQLVSAVSNLVENAVKYSDRGGVVTVTTGTSDGMVTIEVTDEGMGIAPEHVDRVFERFYRVDQARSRQTGGTGLGLAIVRHVATNHGGEVSVRSTMGEGSTFRLSVPAFRG